MITQANPSIDDRAATAEATFGSLVRSLGLLKRVMEPYFGRFGLSGSQWSVLRTLHRAEQEGEAELRLSDLGGRLIVRPPSVTGVVDRLERTGKVSRRASSRDHRVKFVCLTDEGRRLVQRVLRHHPAQIRLVLGGLDAGEQRELGNLLGRLEPHLSSLAAEPGEGAPS